MPNKFIDNDFSLGDQTEANIKRYRRIGIAIMVTCTVFMFIGVVSFIKWLLV